MSTTARGRHARFDVDDLTVYPGNPRRGDVPAIMSSLRAFGQYRPIVVNKGTHTGRTHEVLAGNHTLLAHRELAAAEPETWSSIDAWVVDVDDESAARIVAADNRTAELGGYDDRALLDLLDSLDTFDGTGFDDADLASLRQAIADSDPTPPKPPDPDDVPQLPTNAHCKLGDVWALGAHRLAVGDALDPAVLDRLMSGDRADMIFTDPPYGVEVASRIGTTNISSSEARKRGGRPLVNDDLDPAVLEAFIYDALTAARAVTKRGAPVYVTAPPGPLQVRFGSALDRHGIYRQTLVWVKDKLVLGRSHFHYRHEPLFYGWVPGHACLHAPDTRTNDSIWAIDRPSRANVEHPTMKPVALVERAITLSSRAGGTVLDMFAGSGTTVMAAHYTGRVARVVEIDPRYADVIARRWGKVTGEPAINTATGAVFPSAPT